MEESSPVGSPKGSQEPFGLSSGPLESQKKEADSTASQPTLKAFPTKPEKWAANTEWPALPVSFLKRTNETAPSTSPIQPKQRPIKSLRPMVMPASWKVNQKTPEDYEKDLALKAFVLKGPGGDVFHVHLPIDPLPVVSTSPTLGSPVSANTIPLQITLVWLKANVL